MNIKDIKLSYQEGKGYKKSIGTHIGRGGKSAYKMWYLGLEKTNAQIIAQYISMEWKQLKASGSKIWTDEAYKRIEVYKSKIFSAPISKMDSRLDVSSQSILASETDTPIITFYQAIDYYCKEIIPNLSVKPQWKTDLSQRMTSLKDALEETLLSKIGSDDLASVINYYKKRPYNKNKKKVRISIDYAITLIKTTKRLFEWLDDNEHWEMPKRFDKLFRVSTKSDFNLSARERINALEGKPIFNVDELVALYKNANTDLKKYMLLSLNCGFLQSEIDSLLIGEVFLNEPIPYIHRIRPKTGKTLGKWLLWDETLSMLEEIIGSIYPWEYKIERGGSIYYKHIRRDNWQMHDAVGRESFKMLLRDKQDYENRSFKDTDYIFGGLVYVNEKGTRVDNVATAWDRLKKKTKGVRQYSYKSLRKTGADMIEKISGSEKIAEIYLSHNSKTVAGRHYTDPDYERLAEALEQLREKLQPMFDFEDEKAK